MRLSPGLHFRRSLCLSGPAGPGALPTFFPGGALPGGVPAPSPTPELLRASNPALRQRLSRSAAVFAAFVSPAEGAAVLREAEEALRRRRYEDGHWDGVSEGKGQRSRGAKGRGGRGGGRGAVGAAGVRGQWGHVGSGGSGIVGVTWGCRVTWGQRSVGVTWGQRSVGLGGSGIIGVAGSYGVRGQWGQQGIWDHWGHVELQGQQGSLGLWGRGGALGSEVIESEVTPPFRPFPGSGRRSAAVGGRCRGRCCSGSPPRFPPRGPHCPTATSWTSRPTAACGPTSTAPR